MSRRPHGLVLFFAALAVFALGAWWWTGFLSADLCREAGGTLLNGECVGALQAIPYLWESSPQRIAYVLIPPGVVAIIAAAVLWTLGPAL